MSSATTSLASLLVPGSVNAQLSKRRAVVVTCFGVCVAVRVSDPAILPYLLDRLPPGSRFSPAQPARIYSLCARVADHRARRAQHTQRAICADAALYEVRVGNRRLARGARLADALDAFESDLQIHVAEMCEDRVFVHAGVVGWRGKAILFPGPSGCGKTTLVAELIKRGATYYSDEYAVLDGAGRVHPYPRALNSRTNGDVSPTKCQPESLGGTRGTEPLPLGLIVVSHYKEGVTWAPRELSAGHSVLALISNTVSIRRQPKQAVATLCHAAAAVSGLESPRGDAASTAERLISRLEINNYWNERKKATRS